MPNTNACVCSNLCIACLPQRSKDNNEHDFIPVTPEIALYEMEWNGMEWNGMEWKCG